MMNQPISGHTALYAVIGSPVKHSMSPAMHNYSFQALGMDSVYLAFEVAEEDAGKAVQAIRTFDVRGCNVTMPHKRAVMPFLDALSPEAELMDAVNTIVNRNGHLTGYNTDGQGFVLNLADHGTEVAGKRIAVAGAGGAATAIQVQCALSGAAELVILQRQGGSFRRAQDTAVKIRHYLEQNPSAGTCVVSVLDLEDPAAVTDCVKQMDLLINATSVGMKPIEDQTIIRDTSAFHPDLVVADAVYNPVETKLLREAAASGCRTVDGRGMLLWQGAAAFRLFTGQEMPVDGVKKILFGTP